MLDVHVNRRPRTAQEFVGVVDPGIQDRHPDARAVEAGRLHRRRPDVWNGLAQIKLIIYDRTDSLERSRSQIRCG